MEADAQLIQAMIQGSSEAFAEVYRRYRTRLHQYALSLVRSRMEAEDVVHDVFIGLAKQASDGRAPRELGLISTSRSAIAASMGCGGARAGGPRTSISS